MENYYTVLKILSTATPQEIKDAYARSKAQLMASGLPDSELAPDLEKLDKAFAVLNDPGERTNYDRSLGTGVDGSSSTAMTLLERPGTILRPETPTPFVQQLCPFCNAPNPVQATMCGQCGKQISRPCPSCGQAVSLTQSVCSRCNTYLPEYDQRNLRQAIVTEQKIQTERREGEAKVEALESGHRVRAIQGVFFWILVGIACLALASVPIFIYQYVINKP